MLIVIDGPDGSGKTTICKKLQEIIQTENGSVEYRKLELSVKKLLFSNLLYELGNSVHVLKPKSYSSYQKHYGHVLYGHVAPTFREKMISAFYDN
jgi:ABC-type cobalamin/Fe3+-siderophores transport system ATPase subunit